MPACCSFCKSPNVTSVCGKCKSLYYCNRECQRKDWKEHKKQCKTLAKQNKTKHIADESKENKNKNSNVRNSDDVKTKQRGKELCKLFGSARGCNDEKCPDSHDNPNSIPFCRHYFSKKGCKFNENCKFRHKHHETEDADSDEIVSSLSLFIRILAAKSIKAEYKESNLDFHQENEEKIDILVNNKINEINEKMDNKTKQKNNADTFLSEMMNLLQFYTANFLIKIKAEIEEDGLLETESIKLWFGIFNSIILISEISETVKFYEKKFEEKNVYHVAEFGAMYCQYYYCKHQKDVLITDLVKGNVFIGDMDRFLIRYYENYDDGGYSGLIPADICQELANQCVKPWDGDAMSVVGVLHMDEYQCVNQSISGVYG